MTPSEEQVQSPPLAFLSIKFGLWALLAFLTLGLALEGLNGFKVSWYLEFETRRLMWTLAHAHGVLLSMLVIGFGMMLHVLRDVSGSWPRTAAICLMAATILLPGGFLLGGTYVHEGDPGLGVVLSPVGGVLLFVGVLLMALHYRPDRPGETPPSSEG